MQKRLEQESEALAKDMVNLDKKEDYLEKTYANSKSSLEQVLKGAAWASSLSAAYRDRGKPQVLRRSKEESLWRWCIDLPTTAALDINALINEQDKR